MILGQLIAPGQLTDPGVNFAFVSLITFVFLTTDKTITHKLFHSPRSSFCVVTACAGGHTTTGRPSFFTKWIIIIVIIMICDPYFS